MKKIGITGNIGGGKSEVTNYLKSKNYKVLDADKLVAEIYFDKVFIADMKIVFKSYDISNESGGLDKKKIAELVFNNSKNLDMLNLTISPYIKQKMDLEIEYYQKTEDILFLDIPLLFEKNMQEGLDGVILVYCDDDIRYKRASLRDNKTVEEIKKIDSFQMSQKEKLEYSDYILDNSKDREYLYAQVEMILKKISDTKVD
ncbi:MAG: dephospho-CoA kinase [Proteocatella sp.]